MHNKLYTPPLELQRDITGIRVIQGSMEEAIEVKTCALVVPGIVFHFSSTGPCIESIATRSENYSNLPPLFLHGCRLEPSIMRFRKGQYTTIQVAFKPWALKTLFDIDGTDIVSKPFKASEFGATDLQVELLRTDDIETRIRDIENFLTAQLSQHGRRDVLVEESIAFIDEHIATITVNKLATHFNVSERRLQKRFALFIGCTPQKFIQIQRVDAALYLMWSGQYQKLSDIAYALNYHDQSHFIRDIKTFSWLTPTALTQSISEFRQDESGVAYI